MHRVYTMEELAQLVNELEIDGKFDSNFVFKVISIILFFRR